MKAIAQGIVLSSEKWELITQVGVLVTVVGIFYTAQYIVITIKVFNSGVS